MSVISVTLLSIQRSADATVIVTTYVGKYAVEVSSANDSAVTVGQAAGIPSFGSPLNIDPLANVISIKPNRDNKSQTLWYVDVTWSRLPRDKEREKQDGTPDDNPANWRDKVELNVAKFTGPVEKSFCLMKVKAIPNSGAAPPPPKKMTRQARVLAQKAADAAAADRKLGPVMVASGEIPDPPPERDYSRLILKVTRFSLEYPYGLSQYIDTVNSDQFTINHPGMSLTVPPFMAKFEPYSTSLQYHINRRGVEVPYWETRIEVALRVDTWHLQLLNRGFGIRQEEGDQDDQGQTVGGFQYSLPSGGVRTVPGSFAPRIARMHDHRKIPVPPMLLDLDGQRLPAGATPIFLPYQIYPETPFAPLNL